MDRTNTDKVYEEWDYRLIKSSEGLDRYYRIFYGTVFWQDKVLRKACVIFVQYGNTEDWKTAWKRKEIAYNEPAHILLDDYPHIASAIKELTSNYS